MKTSINGVYDIISHEAIVLSPYYDSKGILTIGIGHTKGAGGIDPANYWGKKLTVAEALDIFRKDLVKFEDRVNKAFTVPLTQEQFDAAVSFDFNTGAIHKATWVKSFNAGKKSDAIKEILNWSKPVEIIPRRTKEQELFAKAKYSNAGKATLYEADAKGVASRANAKSITLNEVVNINVVPMKPVVKPAPVPVAKPVVKPLVIVDLPAPAPKQGFFSRLFNRKK